MSLGTKVSVTSWICVTDWNSDTARPTARLMIRIGAQSLAQMIIVWTAISMTLVSTTGS